MKSQEETSAEKKEYYLKNRDKILARYKKRIYDLQKNNRTVPFVSYRTTEGLLPEHSFSFAGNDVSEERFNFYMDLL